jgi:tRNA (guanine10-N2)-methyltransferase
LIQNLKDSPREQLLEFKDTAFKFNVDVFGSTLSLQDQIAIIEKFEFLPLAGKIDLKSPDEIFTLHFDYGCQEVLPSRVRGDHPLRVFFGRLV